MKTTLVACEVLIRGKPYFLPHGLTQTCVCAGWCKLVEVQIMTALCIVPVWSSGVARGSAMAR